MDELLRRLAPKARKHLEHVDGEHYERLAAAIYDTDKLINSWPKPRGNQGPPAMESLRVIAVYGNCGVLYCAACMTEG
jgi:hypothetical protein